MLRIELDDQPEAVIVKLTGKLTATTSSRLNHELDVLIRLSTTTIIFDLSGISSLNSSGLCAIFDAYLKTRETSRLMLCRLNQQVLELIKLSGLTHLIPVFPDSLTAISSLKTSPIMESK